MIRIGSKMIPLPFFQAVSKTGAEKVARLSHEEFKILKQYTDHFLRQNFDRIKCQKTFENIQILIPLHPQFRNSFPNISMLRVNFGPFSDLDIIHLQQNDCERKLIHGAFTHEIYEEDLKGDCNYQTYQIFKDTLETSFVYLGPHSLKLSQAKRIETNDTLFMPSNSLDRVITASKLLTLDALYPSLKPKSYDTIFLDDSISISEVIKKDDLTKKASQNIIEEIVEIFVGDGCA